MSVTEGNLADVRHSRTPTLTSCGSPSWSRSSSHSCRSSRSSA